jgi:hypothetical protein
MKNHYAKLFAIIVSCILFATSCSDDNSTFETPNSSGIPTNAGIVSFKNFSLLAAETQPVVIDRETGIFKKTDVVMTAFVADRLNSTLTDAHTVHFRTEYGVLDPSSCVTENGFCTVTWRAIKRPEPGGPGDDMKVTIVAYTIGEESFSDVNGNDIYDDADGNQFNDLEEPYIDADESGTFTAGDGVIDVINGNDTSGANGVHDIGDGFFNGSGCTHSSLCSTTIITNGTIWDSNILTINGPPPTAP